MIPLPREHGAWAMLAISLVAGWLTGGVAIAVAALSIAVVAAFLAQAAWLEWRAGRAPLLVVVCEALVVAVAFAVAAATEPSCMIPGVLVALLGALAAFLRLAGAGAGGRVRIQAWGAHLAGAVALGGVAPLLAYAALGEIASVRLWIGNASSFGAGVLLVRALRDTSATSKPLLAWCLATLAAWGLVGMGPNPWFVALAWLPLPLRYLGAGILRERRASWQAIGLLETALGTWSALWTILSLP